ncbi:DUF4436 family protein [Kitasatospora sp. NPDC002040]|uniref:DUF4436 family protein n=1 Tax=Kitasatospora sp. NPDC002040 TaxID=3154661 RepID=UPI003317692C
MTTEPRRRGLRHVVVLVLMAVLVAAGIGLYFNERNSRQQPRHVGAEFEGDGVELEITAQEIDTEAQQLVLYTVLVPHGSLAESPDSLVFTRAVEVTASSLTKATLRSTPGEAVTAQPITVGLYGGTPSDYPFDRYRISVGWNATVGGVGGAGGAELPVALTFTDADPFFTVRPSSNAAASGTTVLEAKVSRSRSTFILAWFMILAMWALALSVLGGAEVLYRKRQGLVWPALGWMAATLFALVGLRNAAPGTPPIGSLMDYVAFFWAEGIIAASLTCTVAFGIRTERRAAPT